MIQPIRLSQVIGRERTAFATSLLDTSRCKQIDKVNIHILYTKIRRTSFDDLPDTHFPEPGDDLGDGLRHLLS